MNEEWVLYIIILTFLDFIAISSLRRLLNDFLIGARNRKVARNVFSQQSLKDRVLMGYIRAFLKEHTLAFDVYHWMYLWEILTLVPQYIAVLAVYICCRIQNNVLLFSLIAVKGFLCLLLRSQVDSLMRSKYRNGK